MIPRLASLILLIFALVVWMPASAQPPAECPSGLPTRLFPNADGRVIAEGGVPVYYEPSTQSQVLRPAAEDSEFIAWFGPACMEDGVWWFVLDPIYSFGWIMESGTEASTYLVEPLDEMIEDLAPRPRSGDEPILIDELGLQFELSANIAGGADVRWVPSNVAEGVPDYAAYPMYREVSFLGYVGSYQGYWLHIRVYEADAWDAVSNVPVDELRTLLEDHPDTPELTGLEWVNAATPLETLESYLDFQNGQGVRGVVRYAQVGIPPIDGELTYLFAGLTEDERYLVRVAFGLDSALIPTQEALDERYDYATFYEFNHQVFYSGISAMLIHAPDEMFRPRLPDIDALIASLYVGEPPEFCGDVPSLLAVDDTVRQALQNDPLRVRETPNGTVIAEFFPGEEAVITAGPECIDGIVWWQVIRPDAWVGWVAEMQGNRYYLERVED